MDRRVIGAIGRGLLVLIGVESDDSDKDARMLADKVAGLRCFADDDSKFNRSVKDVAGAILAVSQFTLFGDCRKGKRPSFSRAAAPEHAIPLYEAAVQGLRAHGLPVETGEFGAHMFVASTNDGPVTLMIDTKKEF